MSPLARRSSPHHHHHHHYRRHLHHHLHHLFICLFCLFMFLPGVWAFFGITARESISTLSWEVQDNVMERLSRHHQAQGSNDNHRQNGRSRGISSSSSNNNNRIASSGGHRKRFNHNNHENQYYQQHHPSRSSARSHHLCKLLKLHRRQEQMCRRGKGVPETLIKATRLSVLECQHQFKYERWNCSLGQYRQRILQRGSKETSFLYAISSAGLVHEIARACSQGHMDRCTCDESPTPAESKKTFLWGGCGDNIRFGLQFTRRFLKKARKSGKDIRAKVDQHNSRVGIKVVRSQVNTTCKCHGVSGSCTVKTCWLQLAPFHTIGNILKRKYEHSVQAYSRTNQATGRAQLCKRHTRWSDDGVQLTNFTRLRRGELAHVEESPSFCRRSRYSPGTQGRVCSKDSSCESICCGRGYNVQHRRVKKACHCEVIWCCKVKCRECWHQEEIYMCK